MKQTKGLLSARRMISQLCQHFDRISRQNTMSVWLALAEIERFPLQEIESSLFFFWRAKDSMAKVATDNY